MSENVVTSKSVNDAKDEKNPVKKTATKKTAAPKKTAQEKEKVATVDHNLEIVVFESGASYSSHGLRFTREDNVQEVTTEQAEFLLSLENFRRPDQFEVEAFLASKED